MAWSSLPGVRLSKRQRRELTKLAARTSAPHALVQRARMILRLASGQWPATVARAVGVSDRCVRKWRARWLLTRDVRGLEDAGQRAAVGGVTCLLGGTPRAYWDMAYEHRRELLARIPVHSP